MKILLLVCLFVLLGAFQCGERDRHCEYSVEQPLRVYPVQDSYQVGDTLWVEMDLSNILRIDYPNDFDGAKFVDYEFPSCYFHFYKLALPNQNLVGQPLAALSTNFEQIQVQGNFISEFENGIEFRPVYENERYKLRYGLVLLEPGTFLLKPDFSQKMHAESYFLGNSGVLDECTSEYIKDMQHPINREPNGTHFNNFHIFESVMNAAIETDIERIQNRTFTFKVEN